MRNAKADLHVGLDNSRPNHSHRSSEESGRNSLEWREIDSYFAQEWVEEHVKEGNKDDERERIKIVDDIVRDTVQFHSVGLRGQVVVDLVVCKPCEWLVNSGSKRIQTIAHSKAGTNRKQILRANHVGPPQPICHQSPSKQGALLEEWPMASHRPRMYHRSCACRWRLDSDATGLSFREIEA
jgi:hypothetical protein